jgi:hypothetical protein
MSLFNGYEVAVTLHHFVTPGAPSSGRIREIAENLHRVDAYVSLSGRLLLREHAMNLRRQVIVKLDQLMHFSLNL